MIRLTIATCLSLSLLAVARAEDKQPTEDKKAEKVTYKDHVLPIFRMRCGSCHNANDRRGGLVLDDFGLMKEGGSSGDVIEPGDPDLSYLWMLVDHQDSPKMPPNSDKLPTEELAVIKNWISMGALEHSGSVADVKKKPSLAKIEVSGARPEQVALPQSFLGNPVHQPDSMNAVTALATSPWASLAAVSGFQQVALYDTQHQHLLGVLPFPEGQAQIIKFSRNGDLLMVGGGRGGSLGKVVVYDVRTGERKSEVGSEYDEVLGADISPDHSRIVLGGPKRMVRCYSTATGEQLYECKKHTDWVTAIAISPDGVLVASGDRSNGLVVWEALTGRLFYELNGHKGAITDISWRPDSNVIASASEDGTIKLWDMQNGNQIKSWNAHGGGVTAMDYTRDGNIVSTGRDRVTRLWKGDGNKIRDFGGHQDIAMEVAYDNEAGIVLAGDWTGAIHVWKAEDGQELGKLGTNPPTASAQLSLVAGQLDPLQQALAQSTQSLQQLEQKLAERTKAAELMVAAMNAAQAKLPELEKAKQAADQLVNAKSAEVQKAEQTAAALQQQVQRLSAEVQAAQQKTDAAQQVVASMTPDLQAAVKTEKATSDGAAQAKLIAEAAEKAAAPTEDEKLALESDELVKQAVEGRHAISVIAKSTLNNALSLAARARARREKVEQQLQTPQSALQKAQAELKAVQSKLEQTQQALTQTQQKRTDLLAQLQTAKTQLNGSANTLAAAAKAHAEAQTKADQAQKAAQPSEDEAKQLATLREQVRRQQQDLQTLQQRLEWFRAASNEVASAAK